MKIVELKEITLDEADKYTRSAYPENGLYIINNAEVFVVSNQYIGYVANLSDINFIEEVQEKTKYNVISEDFALKMLAISLNKEKIKEL